MNRRSFTDPQIYLVLETFDRKAVDVQMDSNFRLGRADVTLGIGRV